MREIQFYEVVTLVEEVEMFRNEFIACKNEYFKFVWGNDFAIK